MFKDYKSLNNQWYTFRPLPLFKREELSKRFNQFNKLKKISVQVVEDDFAEYNLKMILELYDLKIDNFELEEIDSLIVDYILPVNYNAMELKKTTLDSTIKSVIEKSNKKDEDGDEDDLDILSKLFTSVWGICDNAGDALYMIERIPADILMNTIKYRSEDLERIYSTPEEKQKKSQKSIKEQLMKKAKNYEG